MKPTPLSGATFGLASAILFGASTPFAKLVLGTSVNPWVLAALLYLGSGAGLAIYHFGRRVVGGRSKEAPLRAADAPWLAGAILSGGVIAPVLLMVGLATTLASAAALLLNLEGVATIVIAWAAFREHFDRRILIGAVCILAGATLLSWQGSVGGLNVGALAIAGACLGWGIDNNLTRKISATDPVQIAMLKGLVAGTVNLILALAFGAHLPPMFASLAAGFVGLLGYGVSLVFFVMALRLVGAARTGAYFSAAPFVGAIVGILMFQEPLTPTLAAAALLMAAGLYLHLVERHAHEHAHKELEHEHAHAHDDHHQHAHADGDPPGEPHSHPHRHARLVHSHPHFPDLHHRHSH